MESVGRAQGQHDLHAYMGAMRWRAWLPGPSGNTTAWPAQRPMVYERQCAGGGGAMDRPVDVGCACGHQSEAWPADGGRTLGIILCQMGRTGGRGCEQGARPGSCKGALGPFPFADGSLALLSRPLIVRTLTTGSADFSDSAVWTHEDAGVGYLLLREVPVAAP